MSAPVDPAISVTRDDARAALTIVIERRRRRTLTLGYDEAAILAAKLTAELPAVTTRTIRPESER